MKATAESKPHQIALYRTSRHVGLGQVPKVLCDGQWGNKIFVSWWYNVKVDIGKAEGDDVAVVVRH